MTHYVYNSTATNVWRLHDTMGYVSASGTQPMVPSALSNSSGLSQENLDIKWEPLGSDGWIQLIRERLFEIDGVESLYIARDENTMDVWVIIPKRDLALVRRISEAERAVMRLFVNKEHTPLFLLDFHTIYKESHQEDELVPRTAVRLPRP